MSERNGGSAVPAPGLAYIRKVAACRAGLGPFGPMIGALTAGLLVGSLRTREGGTARVLPMVRGGA